MSCRGRGIELGRVRVDSATQELQSNELAQRERSESVDTHSLLPKRVRLVVVGDSLSAGFQNSSLLDSQQPHGYASLIADQARTTLPLPLIAAPGLPNVLTLVSSGPPPVIVPAPGSSTGRTNPLEQPLDLAVPAANVQDALTTLPTPAFNTITDLVLGLPEGLSLQD